MSSPSNLCDLMQSLSNSSGFKIVLIVKLVIIWFGVGLLGLEFFTKPQGKRVIFHPNTVMIFNYIRFLLLVFCLGYSSIHAYDLYRISYPFKDNCDRLISARTVIILRMIVTVSTVGLLAASEMLGLERFFCTWKLYSYEKSVRPFTILAILIFLTTFYCMFAYYFMFWTVDPNQKLATSSSRNSKNGFWFNFYMYFLLISEFVILIGFCLIRFWNNYLDRRVRRVNLNSNNLLSMKFQIKETLKIMNCYLPFIFGQFLVYIVTVADSLIVPTINDPTTATWLNEALFIHFSATHVFSLVMLQKTGKLEVFLCHATKETIVTNELKAHAVETVEEYYQRQNIMFGSIEHKKIKI